MDVAKANIPDEVLGEIVPTNNNQLARSEAVQLGMLHFRTAQAEVWRMAPRSER